MSPSRYALSAAVIAVVLFLVWLVWPARTKSNASSQPTTSAAPVSAPSVAVSHDDGVTTVYAHNLMLRKGPDFRIYVRWIRGQMLRTRKNDEPSLDDPESFVFLIEKGVIHANLGDVGTFLNTNMPRSPLKKIAVAGEGDQLKITGTLHKLLVPLPVEMVSTISAMPDGRVHLHITKIGVLRMPVKGLMRGLHLDIKDVVGSAPVSGVEVSGNDLYLDTTRLLPPPHIRGLLTSITVAAPDLVLVYGNAPNDETKLAEWHNFLRFEGGTVDFGKLTMHRADLTLIDASDDPWFDLDLVNYQAQLVNGVSRMTPEAGLEIFMPDLNDQNKSVKKIPLDWLKDRNRSLPQGVPVPAK
jgi:hypothetical protein